VDTEQLLPPGQLSTAELTAASLGAHENWCRDYLRILELFAEVEHRGHARELGYRNTITWATATFNISTHDAKARLRHALALIPSVSLTGTPQPAALPLTAAALAAGAVTPEHVDAIHNILSDAPDTVSAEDVADAEGILVNLARHAVPFSVRKAGLQLLAHWQVEGKKPKDDDRDLANPVRRLKFRFDNDGQMHLSAIVDSETGARLTGMIDPMSAPESADDPRTLEERQGDALADVVDLASRAPDLPAVGGDNGVAMVTVKLSDLQRQAGVGKIDGIGPTSMSRLRRWCCDVKIIPVVLGSTSEVLDMGREERLATRAQRHALAHRDGGCARPGCTRPPKYCRPHHIIFWADGGLTDLDNLVLLCDRHHREIHHTEWTVQMRDDLPEFIPPKWMDPEQKPIQNTAHQQNHHQAS
jgi:hypothetical protein